MKAFTSNAYIIMSMKGSSFCNSGKRAAILISNNFMGIAAIQTVGDFVLYIARIFIVLVSVFIGIELVAVS